MTRALWDVNEKCTCEVCTCSERYLGDVYILDMRVEVHDIKEEEELLEKFRQENSK